MNDREQAVRERLELTLEGIDDPAPTYRGKVRDVYATGDELILVATDRVSAFDVVLGTVPLKGALLTEQATFWLERAADVVPTHFIERIDAQAMRCKKAQPLPIEVVVRGYLAGSLMRAPKESRGQAYGLTISPDIPDYGPFGAPIITPTTKAEMGEHDAPVSKAEILREGVVERRHLDAAYEAARALFTLGSAFAEEQGLLLVDTKYEFGLIDDEVVLIDEIHTADSSRYWVKDTYEACLRDGNPPEMLDKERLRRWLLGQGYQGHGEPPELRDEVRVDLAVHYWDLTERLLGRPFVPPPKERPLERVQAAIRSALAHG